MKTSPFRTGKSGFVSYVLVLTTGAILTLLMVFTYRQALATQAVQSQVQLRNDYSEKEDAILRSIVAITPNRAIRAMQSGSGSSTTVSNPLRWRNIFDEALSMSNASASISPELLANLGVSNVKQGNAGDSTLTEENRIFHPIGVFNNNTDSRFVTSGLTSSLGTGFPVPLQTNNSLTTTRDTAYPIISNDKIYGALAQSGVGLDVATYPRFNLLKYPQINFGYAKPGDNFVAKRNWWAFEMDVAYHDFDNKIDYDRNGEINSQDYLSNNNKKRQFVLSIYEVPSQLAISASSFLSLGQYASGEVWKNVDIKGGVFAGKADVQGNIPISNLSSRRSMTLSADAKIGQDPLNPLKDTANPFEPGVREKYQVTEGDFFPVSLASESGRVAFIPINRGPDFFDRLAHVTATNTISPTTWNNYSVGAMQCAMRLDITGVKSSTDHTPTRVRFSYWKAGSRVNLDIDLNSSGILGLPPGYLFACNEGETYRFGTSVVDLAYGKNGAFAYQTGITGTVTFNNTRFGDPLVSVYKSGYYKPSYPFEVKKRPLSNQWCVWIYPQRFKNFLASLNADSAAVNHSLVVNVDYTVSGLNNPDFNPIKNGQYEEILPGDMLNYGLVLQESADLTSFSKGFSLVSNLRTYFGDDFNIKPGTPPAGYTPTGTYYPPCSIFVPEKRYGLEADPYELNMEGQVGSLASEDAADATRPLDSKTMSGTAFAPERITVNLRPITHPAELPPITMMNWLVVLEEKRTAAMAGY